jgi:hypothetical protein
MRELEAALIDWKERALKAERERDEARAEVGRWRRAHSEACERYSVALTERDEARAESERLRAALSEAMRVFQGYAAGHAAKRTPEGDQKAATNHNLAAMCSAALGATPAPEVSSNA